MSLSDATQTRPAQVFASPPPSPPPRGELDQAVRKPELHQGAKDAPPPQRYVEHEVARGETVTEIANRYQTTVPMMAAANPHVQNIDRVDVEQKLNVPIGKGYGEEPTPAKVEPGQTLTEMAKSHQLPLNVVVAANRHSLSNPNSIRPGQQIMMPVDKPDTPLEQRVQATDAAMAEVGQAQSALDAAHSGAPASPNQLERLSENLASAQNKLEEAVGAELSTRVRENQPPGPPSAPPSPADHDRAEQQIKERYTSSPAEAKQLDTTLQRLSNQRDAASIVQSAGAAGTPQQQVEQLQTALKDASPELRAEVLNADGAKQIVQGAADWATESLKGGDAQAAWEQAQDAGAMSPAWSGNQAMDRLDQVTRNLDPELAAQVMAAAIPTVERYTNDFKGHFGGTMLAANGTVSMQRALERSLDTTTGRDNLQRLASLGIGDSTGVWEHISQGGSTAYGVALAQSGKVNPDMVLANVYAGVEAHREKIAETAKAYGEHFEELGWLVNSHGGSMTPEQLQKAIEDYTADKGPEWEQKGKELQEQLAAQGAALQTQLVELGKLPAGTYGRDEAIANAMNDPVAGMALNTAWEKIPSLLQGARGDSLLEFFADPTVKGSARMTDVGRRLLSGGAMAWMKSNTGTALANFNPSNPASVASAQNALQSLRNSNLTKILGVSTGEMDKAIEALTRSMPAAGDTAEQIAAKMAQLDTELGTIGAAIKGRYGFDPSTANEGQVAFSRATVAGQLMRGVGVMLGGVGLLASTNAAIDDPSLRTWLKVASDSAGLVQRGLELGVGVFKWNEGTSLASKVGTGAGSFLAGRLLGAVSSVFDVWAGVEAAQQGDYTSAGLYGAGAAGTLMASLFTGPVGWIGLAVVGASAAGLWIWNGIKEANKHEPDSDSGTSMRFLQHAGLDEVTARALTDQSGDGHSPMRLLERYAELKGYDLQQPGDQKKFVDWLNAMPKDELGALRDNLHQTLDEVEGDVSKFTATSADDESFVRDTQDRPWFAASGVSEPASVAQLEAILGVLNLPALPAP